MNEKFEQAITALLDKMVEGANALTPQEIQALASAVYTLKTCSNVATDYRIG